MPEHRFEMGDVFPAEDELARWVMVLSVAWQDLLASNLQLIDDREVESFINLHNIKKVAAQVWELWEFLDRTKETESIKRFWDSLAEQVHAEYAVIVAAISKPAVGARPTFKNALRRARNYSSHYAELDRKDLGRAMHELSASEGVLRYDESFGSLRAEYADLLSLELFFRGASVVDARRDLETFLAELRDVVAALMRFIQRVLDAYLRRRLGVS